MTMTCLETIEEEQSDLMEGLCDLPFRGKHTARFLSSYIPTAAFDFDGN